jgi:micrococcal nuclease
MSRLKAAILGLITVGLILILVWLIIDKMPSFSSDFLVNQTRNVVIVPSPQPEMGLVTKVIDGDTIELSDGRKIRYIGIDAPELHHPQKGKECFGEEAHRRNQELVLQKWVKLEKDQSETDRYDRLLRYVKVENTHINEVLVSEGYAVAKAYPPDTMFQELFTKAQSEAQLNNLGVWETCL